MASTAHRKYPLPDEQRTVAEEFYNLLQSVLPMVDLDVHSLSQALAGKASLSHPHEIAHVTGLSTALAGKMPISQTFHLADLNDVEGAEEAPDGYVLVKIGDVWLAQAANAALGNHKHNIEAIDGLQAELQKRVGNLSRILYHTTSGTYTPAPGVKAIRVRGCGGGGGSGGVDGLGGSSQRAFSCGGSGGSYFDIFIPSGDLAASYECVIGAGGTAGSSVSPGGDGGTGGTTSFSDGAKTATAQGGAGGRGMQATSSSAEAGPTGPVRTASLIGFVGLALASHPAVSCYLVDGKFVSWSKPGSSPLGVPGPGHSNGSDVGVSGSGYGAGAGPASVGGLNAANYSGAAGTPGVIIIEEYV